MDPQLIVYISLSVIAVIMIIVSLISGKRPVGHL